MDFIVEWIENLSNNSALVTFIVSMVPVIELRGALPIGVGLGMPIWEALAVSVIGNMVPIPFILLFIRKIFAFMRKYMPHLENFVTRMEERAEKKKDMVLKWQFWGLMIFVAIPLPGTGAWTGALVAALMDMRLKKAVPAIFMGVIVAGLIVTVVTYGITAIF